MEHSTAELSGALVKGSLDRVADPHVFDAIFPVIAFLIVFLVPTLIALWVIFKTITEKDCSENER